METRRPKTQALPWIVGTLALLILWACLWPVTGEYPASNRTITLSHVKELGVSIAIYSNDFDDKMPLAGAWMSGVFPYVRDDSVYQDSEIDPKPPANPPADEHLKKLMTIYPSMQRLGLWGIAFDVRLNGMDTAPIKDQDQRLSIYTSKNTGWNATDPFTTYQLRSAKATIGFVDTHAKRVESTLLHTEQEFIRH